MRKSRRYGESMPAETSISVPALREGEFIRFVSTPQEQSGAASRHLRILIASIVILVLAGLAFPFFPGQRPLLIVVAVLAVVSALLFTLLFVGARKAAGLTGDDLIDLIVVPQGFITQGGFVIPWQEVSKLEVVTFVPRSVRGSVPAQAGAFLASRLAQHEGADIAVRIHLHDCKAAIARATKMQKLALIDDIGGKAGYAQCALGLKPAAEISPLLPILEREAASHRVPLEFTTV